jgi:replicative DNA helicase
MMPRTIEAEEAVLGSIVIDPACLTDTEVLEIVSPDDFYIRKNGFIFKAVVELFEANRAIDFVTLSDKLDAQGLLEEIGGAAYLTNLFQAVPSALNVASYAEDVASTAKKRRLIHAGSKIVELATNEEDADEAVEQAEAALFNVTEDDDQGRMVDAQEAASTFYAQLEERHERGSDVIGIATGLTDLDRMVGGFQEEDLILIAARPSMGKTALATTIMNNATNNGKRVAMFSLEMSHAQVMQRIVAQRTGLNVQDLRLGRVKDEHWPIISEETGIISELPMHIDDTPAISTVMLKTKTRRLQRRLGLDLVIVDYLQLMHYSEGLTHRATEITYISQQLKALARDLHVPIIALSQLNRDLKHRADKHPTLADLRGSGSLEQDADIVMFLTRLNKYDEDVPPSETHLDIAKQRNGPTGRVELFFHEDTTHFSNAVQMDDVPTAPVRTREEGIPF